MLRLLLDKFRQTDGPLKQTRLVVGDFAEEMLDLAEHYIKQICSSQENHNHPDWDKPDSSHFSDTASENGLARDHKKPEQTGPKRVLQVTEALAKSLDIPQNKKKQEFKVLAILWDVDQRNMGPQSAKAVSEHGEKLGLSIRHENVRKVIRMRLDQYVETQTVQVGSGTIYKYRISEEGIKYFTSKYFE